MWSWSSLCFYIILGLFSVELMKKQSENKHRLFYFFSFIVILLFFAVFRYVGYHRGVLVGGSDAITYISYFDECLWNSTHIYSNHVEIGFQIFTKCIRSITDNYHLYFCIIYIIILSSLWLFVKEFSRHKISYIPMLMIMLIYVKSFTVIRTALSISLILLGIIALRRNKAIPCIVLMLLSVLFQRASVVYACFPLFYLVYQKRKLTKGHAICFVIISAIIGILLQKFLSSGVFFMFSGGAYDKYVVSSLSTGYWMDYLKIIFDQIIVLCLIIFYDKLLTKNLNPENRESYTLLTSMCYYDLLMIPVCGILGIWRANEYFFIARLLMLGMFIYQVKKYKINDSSKRLFCLIMMLIIILWFSFRMLTIYDKSSVMPYILEFFI